MSIMASNGLLEKLNFSASSIVAILSYQDQEIFGKFISIEKDNSLLKINLEVEISKITFKLLNLNQARIIIKNGIEKIDIDLEIFSIKYSCEQNILISIEAENYEIKTI